MGDIDVQFFDHTPVLGVVPNPWNVCDTVSDEYTGCWGNTIVWCYITVCMMLDCVMILEVMVVMVLPTLEIMRCLITPLYLVQGGVQQLLIVELIPMSM